MTRLVLHWRKRAILGDLARGACGTLLCAFVLPSFSILSLGQIAFAGLGALFASYVVISALKLASTVQIDEDGVLLHRPLLGETNIPWKSARSFEVRYFSVGQLQKKSLMDMKISDGQRSILIDDGLEDFATAVRQSGTLARAHGVGVSETTLANIAAADCSTEAKRQHG